MVLRNTTTDQIVGDVLYQKPSGVYVTVIEKAPTDPEYLLLMRPGGILSSRPFQFIAEPVYVEDQFESAFIPGTGPGSIASLFFEFTEPDCGGDMLMFKFNAADAAGIMGSEVLLSLWRGNLVLSTETEVVTSQSKGRLEQDGNFICTNVTANNFFVLVFRPVDISAIASRVVFEVVR